MKTLPSERGQAMVLIALSIVALLGIAALAIDLGQTYAARRNAQNAADAAALAAAYEASAESMDPAVAREKAFSIALVNGFDNNEETNWVRVNNPPIDGPYCKDCPKSTTEFADEYYQVQITARLKPVFAQYIFNGLEEITVEAVAHGTTADEMTAGNALMALNEESDKAMNLDGNIKVQVVGGNIRSNGGLTRKGKASNSYVDVVSPGHIYYSPEYPYLDAFTTFRTKDGKPSTLPEPKAIARIGSVTPPACPKKADTADWESNGSAKFKVDPTFGATTYYYESGLSGEIPELAPGIHCVDGGIAPKGTLSGSGVLVVLMSGGLQMKGNDKLDLRAATDMKDAKGNQWGGMVFFVPPTNESVITFGGNSDNSFYGILYAPKATCDVGGTPEGVAMHSAIVCDTIKVHGDSFLTVQYVPEELFHFPPLVELVQ